MAKLIIDIINPVINLISKPLTGTNSCEGFLEFGIQSTPNASITIAATHPENSSSADDLRELAIDLGAGYAVVETSANDPAQYPFIVDAVIKKRTVTLNSAGYAKVRVTLSNSGTAGQYYTTNIYVKDNTNNKETVKEFTRYNDDAKCQIEDLPIAIDDSASVYSGAFTNIDVLGNDERLHYIGEYNEISIVSQPTHGTTTIQNGYIKYVNNGDGTTTDSFTYRVTTPSGQSNVATVSINVIQSADPNAPTVDNTTNVVIGFDNSGSMDDTLPILQSMVSNELKTALLPYYNSETDYNNRVSIVNIGTEERFLKTMDDNINTSGNTIVLIFQNEAFPSYETAYSYDPLKDKYKTDLSNLFASIDASTYQFNSVIFQVASGDGIISFKRWLQNVEQGVGNYAGNKGFSQRDNIKATYDVFGTTAQGASGQYYTNLIVQELNNLGFNL